MPEHYESLSKALAREYPEAFFFAGKILHRATAEWKVITERLDFVDEQRLKKTAIQWIEREQPLNEQELFQTRSGFRTYHILAYRQVRAIMAPTTFGCLKCGFFFDTEKDGTDYLKNRLCPACRTGRLKQIVYVFVHERCGSVAYIEAKKCLTCQSRLKLFLNSEDFYASKWSCPTCGTTKKLEMLCTKCSAGKSGRQNYQERNFMRPLPAQTAIKPVIRSMIDIDSQTTWEDVVRRRFNIEEPNILDMILEEETNPAKRLILQQTFELPLVRKQYIEEYLTRHPYLQNVGEGILKAIGQTPPEPIQDVLAEYEGAFRAARRSPPLPPAVEARIARSFKMRTYYINTINIQRLLIGYRVGSSKPDVAKLMTFDDATDTYILTHPIETEACLFELTPQYVVDWINAYLGKTLSETELNRQMIIDPEGEVYDLCLRLLHTLSHLLIRNCEIYTGLSRTAFAELLFPPALAFMIYCQDGSELGALRTTCTSTNILNWLNEAAAAARSCAYDPRCRNAHITETAACHACLHIGEGECNTFFNEHLDRRLVLRLSANERRGFLDQ